MASRLLLSKGIKNVRQIYVRPQVLVQPQVTKIQERFSGSSHGDSAHGDRDWRDNPADLEESLKKDVRQGLLIWIPAFIVIGGVAIYNHKREHLMLRQPYRPYAATAIRIRDLPFRDGDHSLFFNPQTNWTSKGYDEEEHHH